MTNVFCFLDNDNQFVSRLVVRGLARYAKTRNWNVEFLFRTEVRRERHRLNDLVRHCRPDGIVAAYTEGLRDVLPSDLPVVWMDVLATSIRDSDSLVSHDSSRSAELAADELVRLKMPHYAAVGFCAGMPWSGKRIADFSSAVRRHHPQAEVSVWSPARPPDEKGSFRRLVVPWLRDLPKPCGVFAVCDRVAVNVLSAAVSLGLSVPDDLAVVGVDNDEDLCLASTPTLTSVATDWERGGFLSGEALERKMRNAHSAPVRLTFGDIGIIRRRSTTPDARRVDPRIVEASVFIREHACEGISVADVVRHIGCSRSLAELRYLQTTGHSISEEIREARLSRALVLLAQRDIPIRVISDMCGWKSPMSLRRCFEAKEHMTLNEWRRRALG